MRRRRHHVKTALLAGGAQRLQGAFAIVTEVKVLAHDDTTRVELAYEDAVDELTR